MLTGLPLQDESGDYFTGNPAGGLVAAAELGTPAILQPNYQMPDTGNRLTDIAVGLGHFLQGGSGAEGILGGGGIALSQALGELPAASEALGVLGGVRARNAPLKTLPEYTTRLQEFAELNDEVDAQQLANILWRTTGWDTPSIDLKPRFEINDAKAFVTDDALKLIRQGRNRFDPARIEAQLSAVLNHPELFSNYPELAKLPTRISIGLKPDPEAFIGGTLWSDASTNAPTGMDLNVNQLSKGSNLLGTIIHEVQHALDRLEAPGDVAPAGYSRHGGPPHIYQNIRANELPQDVQPTDDQYREMLGDAWTIYTNFAHENLARTAEGRLYSQLGLWDPWPHYPEWLENYNIAPGMYGQFMAPSNTMPVPFDQQILEYLIRDPRRGLTQEQMSRARR